MGTLRNRKIILPCRIKIYMAFSIKFNLTRSFKRIRDSRITEGTSKHQINFFLPQEILVSKTAFML